MVEIEDGLGRSWFNWFRFVFKSFSSASGTATVLIDQDALTDILLQQVTAIVGIVTVIGRIEGTSRIS
ncbi:hypothetical protein F9K84_07720 [Brucella anthropi]|nr:hypothetical protein F9K84_07720 [Brucella anthropi]